MRWLLALDTTSDYASLALLHEGALQEEVALHSTDGLGGVIFGAIDMLLKRHCLAPRDVSCYAATTGPGSFTGVRVGLAAVKGLAEASGAQVAGVSNLKVLASFGTAARRGVLLDARRSEVYSAVYGDQLELIQPETVIRFSDWLADLPYSEIEFISQDFTAFGAALCGRRMTRAPRALAAAAGRLSWHLFAGGGALDPAALDANYVRRSDAEAMWKEI